MSISQQHCTLCDLQCKFFNYSKITDLKVIPFAEKDSNVILKPPLPSLQGMHSRGRPSGRPRQPIPHRSIGVRYGAGYFICATSQAGPP